jgi:hypothetical protein
MLEVLISDLPEDYDVVYGSGLSAWVVYDVNPDSTGVWVGVRVDDGKVQLVPKRTYRHLDLAERLGLVS